MDQIPEMENGQTEEPGGEGKPEVEKKDVTPNGDINRGTLSVSLSCKACSIFCSIGSLCCTYVSHFLKGEGGGGVGINTNFPI